MDEFTEVRLGHEALDYIRARLAEGESLARHILDEVNLERGQIITYLPAGTTPGAARQFAVGGKLHRDASLFRYLTAADGTRVRMEPVPNTRASIISIIKNFLTNGEGHVALLENAMARSSDSYLRSARSQLLIFEGEVYHFLSVASCEPGQIEVAVREADGSKPPLICAFNILADQH